MRENATSPACLAASTALAKKSSGEPETDQSHQQQLICACARDFNEEI